ncbi:YunG family protein [Brevibacillus choshinensis]|uniref:YunG n=1 Tax=Brevibacillus choshinensis TaxID=54911 RepID=A0ABX7FW98_BRECH|nr:hypothetical protein [Brevibacillus choshinensis]QRG70160.1 hypothetical protein JNE38_14190 [Brevibacillus choshinensis]
MDDQHRYSDLAKILQRVWSIESSSKWTPDNPAKGQCGVTALVVHDLFSGDILKTQTPDGWHYYNLINGVRRDFTESQFTEKVDYQDVPSNRDEAFSDTNEKQYGYLKSNVLREWSV